MIEGGIQMHTSNEQVEAWCSDFGRDYTDRNSLSLEEMDALYYRNFGFTRSELNKCFLEGLDRSMRILEVGSNVGNQLLCLQKMGFSKLYGIELQNYAVEKSKFRTRNINIIQSDASDIPFKDSYFDMVFTSGVLIHVAPSNLPCVMDEIHRCSRAYIFGFEYYSDRITEKQYRGQDGLLWKADFSKLYLDRFHDLYLVKEDHIKYLDSDNVDSMFLLKKRH
jgi:pseudaminic acid biosynthesis-associated methylase